MDKLNELKIFFYNHKKAMAIIIGTVVMVISLVLMLFTEDKLKSESIVYASSQKEILEGMQVDNKEEDKKTYYVDIKGEVNTPGVYALEKGKRVVDAINQAGGVTDNANTSLLNLSMEIEDGMVIVVYSDYEVNNLEEVKEEITKKEELCTKDVVNDACICNSNKTVVPSNETKEKDSKENNDIVASEKININKASLEELMTLSKIGQSKAQSIIDYRTQNGNFKTIEEIKNVSGIGDSIFATIKEYITV